MFAALQGAVNAAAATAPVARWAFDSADPLRDRVAGYRLEQHNASAPVALGREGAGFGWLGEDGRRSGHRLVAQRAGVPRLAAIAGPNATVSTVAWVRLGAGANALSGGSFVGGLWQESISARQYALFLDGTGGCPTKDGLVAHISGEGGPSPSQRYCRSRACGSTQLAPGRWHCIAGVYDAVHIRAYVNGTLDAPHGGDGDNPFAYPHPPRFPTGGIYRPPAGQGSPLALGANMIHPGGGEGPGVLGNHFVGWIRDFAVYDQALRGEAVAAACRALASTIATTCAGTCAGCVLPRGRCRSGGGSCWGRQDRCAPPDFPRGFPRPRGRRRPPPG